MGTYTMFPWRSTCPQVAYCNAGLDLEKRSKYLDDIMNARNAKAMHTPVGPRVHITSKVPPRVLGSLHPWVSYTMLLKLHAFHSSERFMYFPAPVTPDSGNRPPNDIYIPAICTVLKSGKRMAFKIIFCFPPVWTFEKLKNT